MTPQAPPNYKLPIFYLTDSILKNVGGPYPSLFARVIVPLYCNCVRQVRRDEHSATLLWLNVNSWPLHV